MGRAPCCDKANVKKGPWAPEEDAKLKEFIDKYGTGGNWIALPQKAGLKRCGKSCRLRWLNYLRPNIKHGEFSDDEDRIICTLYASIGSRWSIIAAQLPGRTDNDIKNYWNTKLKKKLLSMALPSPLNLNKRFYSQFYPPSSFQLPQQTTQDLSSYFSQLNNNNNNNTSLINTLLNHHEQQLQNISNNNPLNLNMTNSSIFQGGQESLYNTSPMQYYPGVGMRGGGEGGMLMFGNHHEGSTTNTCSSSDNGSCMSSQISYGKEIKQEDHITLQGTLGFDHQQPHQSQGFVIDYGNNGGVGGVGYHEHENGKGYFSNNQQQQLTPLQFDLEEVKQLMTSNSGNINNNNSYMSCLLNGENNKTNERSGSNLYFY